MYDQRTFENRTFSGRDNNRLRPTWGQAGEALLRLVPPAYVAGSDPSGAHRPNPRVISNIVCAQGSAAPHDNLTDFVWAWGQFLDHELDLTPELATEPHDIRVAAGDPVLPKGGHIPFSRSIYDPSTGTGVDNPRQQVNVMSSYIDASNVYGADDTRASALRRHDKSGKLKVSKSKHGDLLPWNVGCMPNAPRVSDEFFVAGDIRANEHVVLTALHTLFVREHNRRCDEIAKKPSRKRKKPSGDEIFQQARREVGAVMQVITFNEFLPALLGRGAIRPYLGYNPAVNSSISNIFSTACYRLGHSMVSNRILFVEPKGKKTFLSLRDVFFEPCHIQDRGIAGFLRGLATQRMQVIDGRAVDDLRNALFPSLTTEPREMRDLAALNLQRGRDHGLPSYNECRKAFGLPPKRRFADVTSDPEMQDRLAHAYDDVDDIDVWIGGLVEDHKRGAEVGELIFTVLRDQFERLRDGDRFWFENDPALWRERRALRRTTLRDVITANTRVRRLRANVFEL